MVNNYWSKLLHQRVGRRRALAASGAFGFGAALLAACGGDGDGGGDKANSLITPAEDTFKEAKRGGAFIEVATFDSQTLDPATAQAALNLQARYVYGTLVKEKAGYFAPATGTLTGDLVESWEYSPDLLTITMKLRPGVKFTTVRRSTAALWTSRTRCSAITATLPGVRSPHR